jgi:hypothetical protein
MTTAETQISDPQIQEMQLRPKRGEIMLYISLHHIEPSSRWEALKLAESLGFTPDLRARTWTKDGQQQFGIYALLHYEKRDYDSFLEADYITDRAFEELAHRIVPDIAVHFTYCLKHGRVDLIAA